MFPLSSQRSIWTLLLAAILVLVTTEATEAKRRPHRGARHARHSLAARAPALPPKQQAAPDPPETWWTRPAVVGGGMAATLVGALGLGAGWRRSHRQLQARLRAQAVVEAQLRAALAHTTAELHAVKADVERRREWAQRNSVTNTDNQLRFIGAVALHRARLLNWQERSIYWHCLAFVRGKALQLCPQVNMGEIIRTAGSGPDVDSAYASFNSKRLDMLICDKDWFPLVAIEHQGHGHWEGNAEARDRVKRLALARAGIGLVETLPHMARADVHALLKAELARIRDARASEGSDSECAAG